MCLMCTYPYSMWPFIERRGEERGDERGDERRREERREEWVLLPPHPKLIKARSERQIDIRYDTVESVWTHRTGSLSLG